MAAEQRRLFVGGLFEGISQRELEERFSRYGEVGSVEIISRIDENGDVYKTFGYIDLKADDSNVKKCLQTYNGSKWKGHSLTIQTAKESFQKRLKREREEEKLKEKLEKSSRKSKSAKERLQENFSKAGVKDFNIRNAVPGTEINGEKNWTVTKFGRVVPIVYIRSKNKRKVNKIDPSKHSHALRRVKDENDIGKCEGSLTWELDAVEDDVQYQKRIGAYTCPTKKKKLSHPIAGDVSEEETTDRVQTTGNTFSYQYEDDKRKDVDFEVVSEKFEVKDLTNQKPQESLYVRIYNSSEDEEDAPDNILMLPKAKEKCYLTSTPKRDADKGQKGKIESISIISPSQQRTSAEEECIKRPSEIVEACPSKVISTGASNVKELLKKGISISEDLLESDDVSSSGSDSDDRESEKSLEKPDAKKELFESQKNKAVSAISDAEESGYSIFATKDPVDEDFIDVVNTDSSGKFYYQSAINPLTEKKMYYIILEPQGIEKQELNVLQKEGLSKKFIEKEKGEESEDKVDINKDKDGGEKGGVKRDGRKVNQSITKFVASVTNRSLSDVCDQQESVDDAASVSSVDTDEICSRKVIKSGEMSISMRSGALDVVEFDDQMELLEGENIDGDSRLQDITVKDFESDFGKDNKKEKINEEQNLKNNGFKKETKKDNIYFKLREVADQDFDGEDDDTDDGEGDEVVDSGGDVDDEGCDISEDASSGKDGSGNGSANDDKDDCSGDAVTDEGRSDGDGSSSDADGTGSDEKDINHEEDGSSDVDDSNRDEGDTSTDEDHNSSDEDDSSSDEDEGTPKQTSANSINGKNPSRGSTNLGVKEPKKVLDLRVLEGNPAKQASSNIKRLASMQKKSEVIIGQKKAIQKALAAVDSKAGPAQGKHIIFGSDDDDDDDSANIFALSGTNSSELKPTSKGPRLFASDDDDSSDEDDDARFQIKPQFEGKSGERLRKLQEQVGADDRFAMDKRFLEDRSDGDEDPQNHNIAITSDAEDVDMEVDLMTEKEKSMSILQGIVGTKGIASRPRETHDEKLGFLGKMIRYDPSRDDHILYEVKSKEKGVPSNKMSTTKNKKAEVAEITLPEVSKDKYFEVSGDITAAFGGDRKTTGTEVSDDKDAGICSPQKDSTFRFFGDSDDEEDKPKPADDEATLGTALPKSSEFASAGSKFGFFESSDEEMEETKDSVGLKSDDAAANTKTRQWFFFQQDDQRLKEGPLQFCRKENIDTITKRWQENRVNLMTLSRNRYRKAIRQKKKTAQRARKKF